MNLSIKNVPENVVERLRQRAQSNHRSLQGELLAILEDAVRPPSISVAEARKQLQKLHFNTPSETTTMVREDRDER